MNTTDKITIELKATTTHGITFKSDKESEERKIKVTLDWSNVTAEDVQEWAMSNRIIALQRQLRLLSEESLTELNGQVTVHVNNAGKKVTTAAETLEAAKKMLAALPPEVRAAMIASLEK
jgi:hypothetical protein